MRDPVRTLRLVRTLEATAVLLFLLQSVRALFSVLFGLIYDTVFSGPPVLATPVIVGGFDPAPTSPVIRPAERIDFVWLRGLDVKDARVLDSLASDHRMVLVEASMP